MSVPEAPVSYPRGPPIRGPGLEPSSENEVARAGWYATMLDVADPVPIDSRALRDLVEPRVSYVIARLERAVRQGINERVRPYGLTTLQYTTLSVLGRGRGRDGLSNAQLARRSFMTPQAMGEVIEALERAGFVKRNRHPNHRRVFPATMTAKGRRVLAACDDAVGEMEEEMMRHLSPSERAALLEALKSCVRSLHGGLPQR
jgi:DNA-binding MarR family transcriptional regulator